MKRVASLLLLLALAIPAYAGPVVVRAHEIDAGHAMLLGLENTKDYPVTVTLQLPELHNLTTKESLPITRTLGPNEKIDALTLAVVNPTSPGEWTYAYQWTSGATDATPDLSFQYRLPYAAQTDYLVIQAFNGDFSHQGDDRYCVDWAMAEGSPVMAARGGRVMNVQADHEGAGDRKAYFDKANYIRILHSDGTVGVYLHLRKDGVAVKEGDTVHEGQLIGYSGNTGFSSQPHLHFGVYRVVDGARQESIPINFRSSSESGLVMTRGRTYRY